MDKKDNRNHIQEGFIPERRSNYTDVDSVESKRNDLTAEEFPEGPYGADLLTETLGKSSPWRQDQRPQKRFAYEYRNLHEGLPRVYPPDHDTHDENKQTERKNHGKS